MWAKVALRATSLPATPTRFHSICYETDVHINMSQCSIHTEVHTRFREDCNETDATVAALFSVMCTEGFSCVCRLILWQKKTSHYHFNTASSVLGQRTQPTPLPGSQEESPGCKGAEITIRMCTQCVEEYFIPSIHFWQELYGSATQLSATATAEKWKPGAFSTRLS